MGVLIPPVQASGRYSSRRVALSVRAKGIFGISTESRCGVATKDDALIRYSKALRHWFSLLRVTRQVLVTLQNDQAHAVRIIARPFGHELRWQEK